MSQKVNAVPDGAFSVPPLTTTAGTRVSRRRIKVPCNYPGTNYGHNGQSALPSVVTFDIADNESFLDMEKSMIVLDFKPEFFGNDSVVSPYHHIGFDGSSQALMARVRIGNSQGLIIEECQAYGTWANIMDSYAQSHDQTQHHLLDRSSADRNDVHQQKSFGSSELSAVTLRSHKYQKLFLRFKHSSFLKSCRMIPLFLMRNGIRFEIEFENVYKSMTRHLSPHWVGPYFANAFGQKNKGDGSNLVLYDWWFHQNLSSTSQTDIIIRSNSKLAADLNLREILLSNFNRDLNSSNSAIGTVAVTKKLQNGGLTIPLKVEYVDDFGTSHVLIQCLGILDFNLYESNINGVVEGPATSALVSSDKTQFFLLQTPTNDTAADNDGPDENDNSVWCYRIGLSVGYEGFNFPMRNNSGSPKSAFLPYSDKSIAIYFDSTDKAQVPISVVPSIGSSYSHRILANSATPVTWTATNLAEQPRYAHWSIGNSVWNYSVKNVEMVCDFVKPSSEVFLQFQQSFQAPAGIPYAYKRVLYHTRVLNPSEGLQQISLPISVRSLRGIVCVLSDKLAWSPSSDYTSKSFNALSSFMKRGLIRAQLVIGGQNYPSYDLNLTENGVEQIPELECLFNVAGLGSFNPSFDQKELHSSRNYLVGTGKSSTGVNPFDGGWVDVTPSYAANTSYGIQEYHDTSKFVLGLSTMKKDGDFVTGVDTSQAGSVSLNLFFKRSPDVANMFPGDSGSNRDIFVQVFCLADAVFTLQNDANLVRY